MLFKQIDRLLEWQSFNCVTVAGHIVGAEH